MLLAGNVEEGEDGDRRAEEVEQGDKDGFVVREY